MIVPDPPVLAAAEGERTVPGMTAIESPTGRTGRLPAQYPLTSYFVVAFAFSWIIEAPLALSTLGVLPPIPVPVAAIAIVAATFGPMVAAFVVTALVDGGPGVAILLRRFVRWRVGVRWYLAVLFGIPMVIIVGTLLVPGAWASFDPAALAALAGYPLAFLMTVLLGGPLGEEPGWRGFALPRLQKRHGPLRGSLILGVLWAAWHLPLFWSGLWTPATPANIAMFTVMIVALTIIMTWVFNHAAGSLLLMILMHASFNTFANRVAAPLFPAPVFTDYGLLPVLIGFGITALVLVAATRGRLGYGAASAATD